VTHGLRAAEEVAAETADPRYRRGELWIGGEWVRPASDAHTDVVDPARDEVIGHVPVAGTVDVDRAVASARAAQQLWAQRAPGRRARLAGAIAEGIRARRDEFAAIISAEMGAPLDNARDTQTDLAAEVFASYVGVAARFEWDVRLGNSLVVHEPVGVVAAITPWNYPLYLAATKLAPALVAGCGVVLKPSGDAPLSAFLLVEVIAQACTEVGAPVGLVSLVTGPGAEVGEYLVAHPGVDAVSFTGSTAAGRRVGAVAAQTVKRVGLELGGKSAAVVLDDVADLRPVLAAALANVFYNSGQTCTACTRILVPQARYAEAVAVAAECARDWRLGDPRLPGEHLGPIATRRQFDAVCDHLRSGVAQGARLVTGGVARGDDVPVGCEGGNWILPTVFADVPRDAGIVREEVFGPVAVLIPYADEDDACQIADDTIYGLAGAVWSADTQRAVRFARRVRTGRVDVNGAAFNVLAPTGGYKQSGNGRELGEAGLREYLEVKAIQT
jgi:acyl-CoA reductase-like NAD-dependent aldehyde dehydrogenase